MKSPCPFRPQSIGYMNLYPYRVIGRVYGTSEKTGRPTNRKKEIVVNTRSLEDAQAAAEAMGVSPPYPIHGADSGPTG